MLGVSTPLADTAGLAFGGPESGASGVSAGTAVSVLAGALITTGAALVRDATGDAMAAGAAPCPEGGVDWSCSSPTTLAATPRTTNGAALSQVTVPNSASFAP